MPTSSPIIYQSNNKDVVLLDLPRSLEIAQSSLYQVQSTTPPTRPYPSTEPKGSKLEKALRDTDPDRLRRQSDLEQWLVNALDEIHAQFASANLPWCYPRLINTPSLSEAGEEESRHLVDETDPRTPWFTTQTPRPPVVLSSTERHDVFRNMADIAGALVCNPSQHTSIQVGGNIYHIPPKSIFILSTILQAQPVVSAYGSQFDLILMDPPWANRSVRRARKYTTDDHQTTSAFLSALPLVRLHLQSNGVVAVWITNKQKVAELVLTTLKGLGLHLQQRWVWLKITSDGKPVTDINGIWRKPYEELLLFGPAIRPVSQRLIVAVPDIHSRKPSLKDMLEEILPDQPRCLELFARSLTAGWWSIGDQVLHFQDSNKWSSTPVYAT